MRRWLSVVAIVVAVAASEAALTAADDSLAAARDLYAAAEYEDALAVLNRIKSVGTPPENVRAIEQDPAYCLLALGRSADAEEAIAAIVVAEPLYQPSDTEVSPRVRSAFRDVRRKLLPSVIEQRYAAAKATFDRRDFRAAVPIFAEVLDVLADSDMSSLAGQSPLSHIRTLAEGFRDLCTTLSAPKVVEPRTEPPINPPPAAAPAPRIYSAQDTQVTPPAILHQALPPYPGPVAASARGVVEVVIDDSGNVTQAVMRVPVATRYDELVVGAARAWTYKPALLDGTPVRYRKLIQISIQR